MSTNATTNKSGLVIALVLALLISVVFNLIALRGVVTDKLSAPSADNPVSSTPLSYTDGQQVLLGDTTEHRAIESSADISSKQVELQRLISKHIDAIPLPSDRYWEMSPAESRILYRIQKLDAYDQVRSLLLGTYGESARTDAAFKQLFFPLYPYERYLSSQEQIHLERTHAERGLASLQQKKEPGVSQQPKRLNLADASARAELQKLTENPLTRDLSADAKQEHAVRHGRAAHLLRETGQTFTESQFRQAFNELQVMTNAQSQLDFSFNLASSLESLSEAIGSDAAFKIWADLDGTFSKLLVDSRSAGLDDEDILRAYDIMQHSMRDFYDAELVRANDQEQGNALMLQAIRDRYDSLAALVGEEVTETITGFPRF